MSISRFLQSPWLFFLLLCVAGIGPAAAEGRCPPGQYPIGDQGVGGCAPIPGGGSGSSGSQEIRLSTPAGHWIKTWGAIAEATATSDAGVSDGKRSKEEAEREAVARCQSTGAKDCVAHFTYYNQCVSWLIPKGRSGAGQAAIASAGTLQLARMSAQTKCKNDVSGICEEVYANCTKPIFEEF